MNIRNIIQRFFKEIEELKGLMQKKDLLDEYPPIPGINGSRMVITTEVPEREPFSKIYDVYFNVTFYKNETDSAVEYTDIDNATSSILLHEYKKKLDEFKFPKFDSDLFKLVKDHFKDILRFKPYSITKTKLNHLILHHNHQLNVYTRVNGKEMVGRTVIQSFDRLEIVNHNFVNNHFLLQLHRNNILLIDYLSKNNFSLLVKFLSSSLLIAINLSRFWILLITILGNFTILSLSALLSNQFVVLLIIEGAFNGVMLMLWFIVPAIIRYRILKFLKT